MPTLSESEFRAALQAAADKRARAYANNFSLHVRFEKDDTRADRDADHFQSFLRALGLAPPDEYIIPATDTMPGWDVQSKSRKVLKKAAASSVLLHYAGHGAVDSLGHLILKQTNSHQRGFRCDKAFIEDAGLRRHWRGS